jgi:ABC-2 type transport system ATP-binding protein
MRIVAGFLGLTSGKVTVAGHDIKEESQEARRKLGYMPEAVPLYPEMRVGEYLKFRAELKRVERGKRAAQVADAMDKAKVTDVANVVIGNLSKGYRQRVGLADALVANPPLLVLDEPTAGLDPNQIREVRDVIKSLGADHTVLLSTHILSEVEASCSRVVVIARGKLVASGSMEEIEKKRRNAGLVVVARGDAALSVLRGIPGIASAERVEEREGEGIHCTWEKTVDDDAAVRATEEAVAALVKAGCSVREVRPLRSTLEELFAELTSRSAE